MTVEPSLNQPNVCRFLVEPALYEAGGAHFAKGDDLSGSPLATSLFAAGDVTEVLIAGNTVTLTTETAPDWNELSAKIAELIRDQINSGAPTTPAFCITALRSSLAKNAWPASRFAVGR